MKRVILLGSLFAVAAALVLALGQPGSAGDEKTVLEGNYEIAAVERDGKKLEVGKDTKAKIAGNKFTVSRGDEVVATGTFKLDTTKKPSAMDATYTEGPDKGKSYKGICKIEGDTFTFCRPGSVDADRPTEFTSAKGGFMATYKKVK